jgi:hypothetical protein
MASRDLVPAVLHVSEADPLPPGRGRAACRISGVLIFDDEPLREVITTQRAPIPKWPLPGDQLPATVRLPALAAAEPRAVSVAWWKLPRRDRLDATNAQAVPLSEPGSPRYRVNAIGDHGRPGSPGVATPQEARGLTATGEPSTGVVLAVTDVRLPWLLRVLRFPLPPGGLVDLNLEITRTDNTTYEARMRIGFSTSERRQRVAMVGLSLPVRIDRTEPDKVAIDTAAFEWD